VKKSSILSWLAAACLCTGLASADEMDDLMAQTAPPDQATAATFKSTRIINLPSSETIGPMDLNFVLQHHLGPLSTGAGQAFGLDMAKIRLGLEYGLTDRLQAGIGRTNGGGKPVDVALKFRLLRQMNSGSMPVGVTVQTAGFYQTASDGSQPVTLTAERRFSSAHHLMVARKWNDRISTEMVGVLVLRNLYPTSDDHFATAIMGLGGRYKLTQRVAVTGDFALPVPPDHNGKYYSPVLGLGLDLDTGGHVFQLFVTNSPWLNDDRLLTETAGTLGDAGTALRLGFQINRTFGFGGN